MRAKLWTLIHALMQVAGYSMTGTPPFGHPLHLTNCDDHGLPTTTVECGQKAIAEHAVAVVGSFTFNGDAVLPELQAANIAWFGGAGASGQSSETSPIVFSGSGINGAAAALIVKAVADGCKHIAQIDIDLGSATDGFQNLVATNSVKALGAPSSDIVRFVTLPLSVTDYSPQVAQATSGTDCIVGDLGEDQWASFMPGFVSTGAHQRLYGYQGNFDVTVTKPFAAATNNAVIAGGYGDISLPAFANFRAALKKYKAPTKYNYNSIDGLGGWAAFTSFAQIADGLKGPITSAKFLAAAKKATVDLPGVPVLNYVDKWTGFGGTQAISVSRSITYDVVQNGVPKPFDSGKFFDMTNAMLGLHMPKSQIPPATKGKL